MPKWAERPDSLASDCSHKNSRAADRRYFSETHTKGRPLGRPSVDFAIQDAGPRIRPENILPGRFVPGPTPPLEGSSMTRSGFLFGSVGPIGGGPGKSPTYQKADAVNHEGFPAFTRSIEETTLSFLMTNMLSNTFYVSQEQNVKETVDVLTRMADKDPVFLAKALVYARNKGLLKLAPTVGLTVLSACDAEGAKTAFRQAFRHVIQIPDDLREFVELCKKAQIRKG